MQKSGGAATHMKNTDIEWIIGDENVKTKPLKPYSDLVIDFLDELSSILRKRAVKEKHNDIMTLAFWCRRGNILKLRDSREHMENRLGRGLVFHITPANVPINFAFSYFFGLLSGNGNIVRVPSKAFEQTDIICDGIRTTLEAPKYKIIKETTAFVRYGHNKEITDEFSMMADVRIIWGGDASIAEIRKSPMKSNGTEIVFADRFSFGIINSDEFVKLSEEAAYEFAVKFYNDTYLMDQNACSTPHLILWAGAEKEAAKGKLWAAVRKAADGYSLEPVKAMDKYTDLCISCCENNVKKAERADNLLYVVELKELPKEIETLRGRYGMFYQYDLQDISSLIPYINSRVQTLLYYGLDKNMLMSFVSDKNLQGIDRIVPFGKALDMGVYWDGYDIVSQLSRIVTVE